MATKLLTPFESYAMTEEEIKSGSILSTPQIQNFHNLRTTYMLEKLSLEIDTANPSVFIQREAYLRGQIDVITYMIEVSQAVQYPQHPQEEE